MEYHYVSKFNEDITDVSLQSCVYFHYMNESSIVTKPVSHVAMIYFEWEASNGCQLTLEIATIDISQTRTCSMMQSCFRFSTNHPDATTGVLCHKSQWSMVIFVTCFLWVNQNISSPCILHISSLLGDITPSVFILQTN